MKRRDFIKGAGAVTVMAAGGGVWRARDRGVFGVGEGDAYEPWRDWRSEATNGPLALVRAGILASNPHNTQPWLFRVKRSGVDLLADPKRHLGTFDPYRREMYLGLGCALENMTLAARANGYEPTVDPMAGRLPPPPGDVEPVLAARVELEPVEAEVSPLYDAIPRRHTNRGAYDPGRPVSERTLAALLRTAAEEAAVDVVLITEPEARGRLGELIVETTESIIADSTMVHDSERWYRHTRSEIEEHRDGPTLDAAGLPPVRTAIAKLLPRPSAQDNHGYWLNNTRDIQVTTAPVFGLILVRDLYDREQALRAGRVWQRMHLQATTQGLAMQPLNQPVEWIDRERSLGRDSPATRALAELTNGAPGEPTFVFRVGYSSRAISPSPRRPVDEVVI